MKQPSNICQRIACKGVIFYQGRVLVLREASTYTDGTNLGKYQLPGGRIEPGEPYKEGLKREVRDETGLTVTVGAPIYVGEWFPTIRGQKHQIVASFFVCESKSAKVTLSDEHDDYKWIGIDEISAYNFSDPEDKVLASLRTKLGLPKK